MKTSSLWIIRVALTVQLVGVLAVPAALAAAESPRAIWMAEWINATAERLVGHSAQRDGRTIGVLKLREGRLSFAEVSGQAEWSIDVASVKRVSNTPSTSLRAGSRTMTIESSTGEIYVMSIMDSNLTQGSPKKVIATIDRALAMIDRPALSEGRRER